jgi:uncharacterized protein
MAFAVALPVVYRVTRDLDFRYNAPVIVPGGIPVDLEAAAKQQHDSAMGNPADAAPPLVQIFPAAAQPASADQEQTPEAPSVDPR